MERTPMREIIFEVTEDEVDRAYSASAIGYGIHMRGDLFGDIRRSVRNAIDCYFDRSTRRPRVISLHAILQDYTRETEAS